MQPTPSRPVEFRLQSGDKSLLVALELPQHPPSRALGHLSTHPALPHILGSGGLWVPGPGGLGRRQEEAGALERHRVIGSAGLEPPN